MQRTVFLQYSGSSIFLFAETEASVWIEGKMDGAKYTANLLKKLPFSEKLESGKMVLHYWPKHKSQSDVQWPRVMMLNVYDSLQ